METEARVREYIHSLNKRGAWPTADPVGDLLASHARQREMLEEATRRHLRAHRRLRYLPFKLRLWLLGF